MNEIDQRIEKVEELLAVKDYNQALFTLEELEQTKLNKNQKFKVLLEKGIVKMHLNDYDQSHSYINQALELGEKNQNRYQQAQALHQLGILTKLLGDYREATNFLRKELRLCSSLMPSYYSDLSYNFFEQGDVKMLSGEFEDAEMYFQHAFTFADTEGNYHGVGLACQALAALRLRTGKKRKALILLEKSKKNFELANSFDDLKIVQAEIDALKNS